MYNLRARYRVNTSSAVGHSGGEGGIDRVTRSAATARANRVSSPQGVLTLRGFGRGCARTPPSQARIDSMFRAFHPVLHLPAETDSDRVLERDKLPFEDSVDTDT